MRASEKLRDVVTALMSRPDEILLEVGAGGAEVDVHGVHATWGLAAIRPAEMASATRSRVG